MSLFDELKEIVTSEDDDIAGAFERINDAFKFLCGHIEQLEARVKELERNPEFVFWLQGIPLAFISSMQRAMELFPKSRRSLSKQL
jgi:hypothetical protein